jgi:hypothetical protein
MQKMYLKILLIIFTFSVSWQNVLAQDDLLQELQEMQLAKTEYTIATFKGSRIINGHSVEMRDPGVLEFLISHRFGRLNSGAYNLFGLDESNIRLGLEYGLLPGLNIGIGRSSFEKTFDGFIKYRLLQQSSGEKNMPVSMVFFGSAAVNSLSAPADRPVTFSERLVYTYQMLIARKFSDRLSLQVAPTVVHWNIVPEPGDDNDIVALGLAGRYKLTGSVALNAEYFYQFNPFSSKAMQNALAVGFDIETGGHVFQLHITNSRAMIEKGFITETNGEFFDGDIHFGFNISRVFQLK